MRKHVFVISSFCLNLVINNGWVSVSRGTFHRSTVSIFLPTTHHHWFIFI